MDKTKNRNIKKKERHTVQNIFKPGRSIEVVFDIDSYVPIVRSSMIYECDYNALRMIISQTQPNILPSMKNKPMDITTLVEEELGRKFRSGIRCKIFEFIKDFRLSKDNVTSAILVEYSPEWRKVNIRSAYRLEPNERFKVEARLTAGGSRFKSDKDFKISNISFTGIGLLIPNQVENSRNKLLDMKVNTKAGIELNLIVASDEDQKSIMMNCDIHVVRINPRFNPKSGYIGAKFTSLSAKDEEILSKFIHDAQMYIIRKSNRL